MKPPNYLRILFLVKIFGNRRNFSVFFKIFYYSLSQLHELYFCITVLYFTCCLRTASILHPPVSNIAPVLLRWYFHPCLCTSISQRYCAVANEREITPFSVLEGMRPSIMTWVRLATNTISKSETWLSLGTVRRIATCDANPLAPSFLLINGTTPAISSFNQHVHLHHYNENRISDMPTSRPNCKLAICKIDTSDEFTSLIKRRAAFVVRSFNANR